jgi:hypothetical protein
MPRWNLLELLGIPTTEPAPIGSKRPATTRLEYAIPLTIAEAAQLANSLNNVDVLTRTVGRRTAGVPWVRSMATRIARTVGTAQARGYVYVPISEAVLALVDRAVGVTLELAPSAARSMAFQALVIRMHTLAGMARTCGWAITSGTDEPAWLGPEPSRTALTEGEGGELPYMG